jgi:hypothetical protein
MAHFVWSPEPCTLSIANSHFIESIRLLRLLSGTIFIGNTINATKEARVPWLN